MCTNTTTHDKGNMNSAIPRTDNFMETVNTRMKFFLGDNACVGKDYSGWESVKGEHYDGACRTIRYEDGRLYVWEKDAGCIIDLSGDIADYKGRLIADHSNRRHNINQLRGKVEAYMTEHGITEYSSEIGVHALWVMRYPPALVKERVRVYEMTLNL